MKKTFAEELEDVCQRMYGKSFQAERNRVHQEAVRDENHAFRGVDMPKPDPWKKLDGTSRPLW